MKPCLTVLLLSAWALPAAASAQTPPDNTAPRAEQAERSAALKSGDKAAIAKTTADENAAYAKWRKEHPAAAAVTPQSKAAYEARLRASHPGQPPAVDDTRPFTEQAERNAALKSGDKAAIAQATADENAAFAKWRREHAAAAAVTPQSKAAYEATLHAKYHHRHPAQHPAT